MILRSLAVCVLLVAGSAMADTRDAIFGRDVGIELFGRERVELLGVERGVKARDNTVHRGVEALVSVCEYSE